MTLPPPLALALLALGGVVLIIAFARITARPSGGKKRKRSSVAPGAPREKNAARATAKAAPASTGEDSDDEVTVVGKMYPDDDEQPGPNTLVLVTAVGRTDTGRRRKLNEDSYAILDDQHLFVVADGMGGHAAGEVASQLAVETLSEAFKSRSFGGTPNPRRPRRGDELVRAIQSANAAVHTQASRNRDQEGMGTTLVAARYSTNKQRVYIAHVGDSRCYRLRDGKFSQLTKDHTFESMGISGPMGHQLSRAVGTDPDVEVELTVEAAEMGDTYVLCSDGLSKMLPDERIRDLLVGETDLDAACKKLIAAANDAGGKDNVTVILVRVQSASAAA